jgi:hypothetical protein
MLADFEQLDGFKATIDDGVPELKAFYVMLVKHWFRVARA